MNTVKYYNNPHKHGKIVHISELEKEPKNYIGETVRVLGKILCINFEENLALLEHPLSRSKLLVDLQFLDNWKGHLSSYHQFIGEIVEYNNTDISKIFNSSIKTYNNGIILRANIYRCIDGLDFQIYEQVVDIRRKFEKKYFNK